MSLGTVITLLLTICAVTALTVALIATIRADGRGHRPPPRSHLDWDDPPPNDTPSH